MNTEIDCIKKLFNSEDKNFHLEKDPDGNFIIKNASSIQSFNSELLVKLILNGWLYNYEHDFLIKNT